MEPCKMYECSVCGRTFLSNEDIIRCECNHFGLTPEERKEWKSLKKDKHYKDYINSLVCTHKSAEEYEEAVGKLEWFEKQHGIK